MPCPATTHLDRWHRLVVAAMATTMLLAGCQSTPKKTEAPPADTQMLNMVRQQISASDPGALVGRVIAVEPHGRPFAAVSDVPAEQFHDGDPITFVDSRREVLTHGFVRRVVDNTVHVEWLPPVTVPSGSTTASPRAPRVGDLAVRYPGAVQQAPETTPSAAPVPPPTTAETTTTPPTTNPPPPAPDNPASPTPDTAAPATQPMEATQPAAPGG